MGIFIQVTWKSLLSILHPFFPQLALLPSSDRTGISSPCSHVHGDTPHWLFTTEEEQHDVTCASTVPPSSTSVSLLKCTKPKQPP